MCGCRNSFLTGWLAGWLPAQEAQAERRNWCCLTTSSSSSAVEGLRKIIQNISNNSNNNNHNNLRSRRVVNRKITWLSTYLLPDKG
ncbi:hypothetical protein GGR56DRAFT_647557, partial [Xylariaceae sp. FL0804]